MKKAFIIIVVITLAGCTKKELTTPGKKITPAPDRPQTETYIKSLKNAQL